MYFLLFWEEWKRTDLFLLQGILSTPSLKWLMVLQMSSAPSSLAIGLNTMTRISKDCWRWCMKWLPSMEPSQARYSPPATNPGPSFLLWDQPQKSMLSSPNLSFPVPLHRVHVPVISVFRFSCTMLTLLSLTKIHFSCPLIANLFAEIMSKTRYPIMRIFFWRRAASTSSRNSSNAIAG